MTNTIDFVRDIDNAKTTENINGNTTESGDGRWIASMK
jgi:hypothetical protein